MSRFIHSQVFLVSSQPLPHRDLGVAFPYTTNPPQDPFELWLSMDWSSKARLALQGHTSLCVGLGQAGQPSGWREGGAAKQPGINAQSQE